MFWGPKRGRHSSSISEVAPSISRSAGLVAFNPYPHTNSVQSCWLLNTIKMRKCLYGCTAHRPDPIFFGWKVGKLHTELGPKDKCSPILSAISKIAYGLWIIVKIVLMCPARQGQYFSWTSLALFIDWRVVIQIRTVPDGVSSDEHLYLRSMVPLKCPKNSLSYKPLILQSK